MATSKVFYLLLSVCGICHWGCAVRGHEQNQSALLTEFYAAHQDIWSTASTTPPDRFDARLDSLHQVYCTKKLIAEAKKYLKNGHDLLTNDWGMTDKSLKTLTIVSDSTQEDTYVVSYVVDLSTGSPDGFVEKRVSFRVALVKEGPKYKIDAVHGSL